MLVSGRVYRFYPLMWRKCRVGNQLGWFKHAKFVPKYLKINWWRILAESLDMALFDLDLSKFIDAILLYPTLLCVCVNYSFIWSCLRSLQGIQMNQKITSTELGLQLAGNLPSKKTATWPNHWSIPCHPMPKPSIKQFERDKFKGTIASFKPL